MPNPSTPRQDASGPANAWLMPRKESIATARCSGQAKRSAKSWGGRRELSHAEFVF